MGFEGCLGTKRQKELQDFIDLCNMIGERIVNTEDM